MGSMVGMVGFDDGDFTNPNLKVGSHSLILETLTILKRCVHQSMYAAHFRQSQILHSVFMVLVGSKGDVDLFLG